MSYSNFLEDLRSRLGPVSRRGVSRDQCNDVGSRIRVYSERSVSPVTATFVLPLPLRGPQVPVRMEDGGS